MDMYPNHQEVDNVISIEYIRATRTLAAVKLRAIARRERRLRRKAEQERKQHNQRVLQAAGLGPKRSN